ncbi:MAG: WecB/TagA/CpsF family glycosyltransferase [Candidatus Aegiribacteria sp.]|nr:WecB/TagA/CpsF family glycosyltransferase [Candidatus Aegiribacteria sp.]
MKTISVYPLDLKAGTFDEAASLLLECASCATSSSIVLHINARNYYFLIKDDELIEGLKHNATSLLDGIGLKLGIWLAGKGWQSDLNGTDLFPRVMKRASEMGMTLFLLGGRKPVTSRVAETLVQSYPGIEVCGYRDGYFAEDEEDKIVRRIRSCRPNILIVGMGFPRQESFSLKYRDRIGANLIWNVGGLFDFVSGSKPRAPQIVRRIRMEWFFRWIVEPRRLFLRTFFYEPFTVVKLAISRFRKNS